MDRKILKRIDNSKKAYKKKSQRAELLKRNKKFFEEYEDIIKWFPDAEKFFKVKKINYRNLRKVSKNNPLIKLRYTKYKHKHWIEKENEALNSVLEKGPIKVDNFTFDPLDWEITSRALIFDEHLEKWKQFCERWYIDFNWDGNIKTINEFHYNSVEIYVNENNSSRTRDYSEKEKWAFFIRFNEWTTIEDIRASWKYIDKIQKNILGKQEKRPNFGRDLCWYDLKVKYGLSPSQIAKIWIEKFPENIDVLALRRLKKDEETLQSKDEKNLMEIVKKDPDYKKDFEFEREHYMKGKYPTFYEIIKKAIKRMEEQIDEIKPHPHIDFFFNIKRVKVNLSSKPD